jgi:hypothetical protein
MDYCHHMTALAPTAPMRWDACVRLGAPLLGAAIAAGDVSLRFAAQRGMVGKGNFNRHGRGSMRETDV